MSDQCLGICAMSVGWRKVREHCNAMVFFGRKNGKFALKGFALHCCAPNGCSCALLQITNYNILQIPDCWDIPQILLEIASYQFCILSEVLELRYFGQYENLTIYLAGPPEKGKSPSELNMKRLSQEVQGAVMSQCSAGRQSRVDVLLTLLSPGIWQTHRGSGATSQDSTLWLSLTFEDFLQSPGIKSAPF